MIDIELDLGEPEVELKPNDDVVKRASALLEAQGLSYTRAAEIAMQLALLAGRRLQDDLAISKISDRLAGHHLFDALSQVENILHFVTMGRPVPSSPEADTTRRLDRQKAATTEKDDASAGRLVAVIRRVAESEKQAGRGLDLALIRSGLCSLKNILQVSLDIFTSPASLSEEELKNYGYHPPYDAINQAKVDAFLTLFSVIAPNSGGRPSTSFALNDFVYQSARIWKAEFKKRPGLTKDAGGNLVGPFFDLLALLASAYPWFARGRLGPTAFSEGLRRLIAEEKGAREGRRFSP